MIYAIGLDSDSTFIHFIRAATVRGIELRAVNVRAVARHGCWRLRLPDDGKSNISVGSEKVPLDPSASYFVRMIDLAPVQPDQILAARWRSLCSGLNSWLEHIPGTVINPPGMHHLHNASKPFHEAMLRSLGLQVPDSLTSSKRRSLVDFSRQGKTIMKTISGIRATTRLVEAAELERCELGYAPVHLQRYVDGVDVRAHVVGNEVHAEMIDSNAVDYRDAEGVNTYTRHSVDARVAKALVQASAAMGLIFSGWDLKIDKRGVYWVLEANPMPGYDGYDRRLGGAISEALFARMANPRCWMDGQIKEMQS